MTVELEPGDERGWAPVEPDDARVHDRSACRVGSHPGAHGASLPVAEGVAATGAAGAHRLVPPGASATAASDRHAAGPGAAAKCHQGRAEPGREGRVVAGGLAGPAARSCAPPGPRNGPSTSASKSSPSGWATGPGWSRRCSPPACCAGRRTRRPPTWCAASGCSTSRWSLRPPGSTSTWRRRRPRRVRKQLRTASSELVRQVLDRAGAGFARSGSTADVTKALGALRPLGIRAVNLIFAQEIERALRQAVDTGKATPPTRAPPDTQPEHPHPRSRDGKDRP